MSLDDRTREAAARLRESTASLEPSPAGLRARRRRGLALRGGAGLGVVVLAALAMVLLVRDGGGDGTRVATTGGGVPRLLPSELPEGFELRTLRELPVEDVPLGPSLRLYGSGDDEDPFARGDLGLLVQPVSQFAPEGEDPLDTMFPEGEPAPLDRPGARFVEGMVPRGATGVAWRDGESAVLVASRSLGRDELLRVAESVRVEDRIPVVADGVLPEELALLAGGSRGSALFFGTATGGSYTAIYAAAGDPQRERPTLGVSVTRGDPGDLVAMRWLLGPEIEEAEVRGRPGLLASLSELGGDDRAPSDTLVWLEDAALITLFGSGVERDELLAVAESLEAVPDDEWERLVAHDSWGRSGGEDVTAVAEGELEDGRAWRITVEEPDGTVCLEVRSGRGTRRSCGPGLAAPPGETVEGVAPSVSSHEDRLLYGAGPPGTGRVEVRGAGGDVLDAPIVGEHDGLRFYLAALPEGFEAEEVVASDGDGGEVGRWLVEPHLRGAPPPPDEPPEIPPPDGPPEIEGGADPASVSR